MRLHYFGLLSFLLLLQVAGASHQVEYLAPTSVTTTVGELTTIQVDIKNNGFTSEYYHVTIEATLPNEIEITNPDVTTGTIAPGTSTSIFTNIRSFTENNNGIVIKIYRDNDNFDVVTVPTIPVRSKKYSLPEFGLPGLLQIIVLAGVAYFFAGNEIIPRKSK